MKVQFNDPHIPLDLLPHPVEPVVAALSIALRLTVKDQISVNRPRWIVKSCSEQFGSCAIKGNRTRLRIPEFIPTILTGKSGISER